MDAEHHFDTEAILSKFNTVWLVPLLAIEFLLVETLWLVLYLAGFVIVPVALEYADREEARAPEWSAEKTILVFKNRILNEIYGNREDGLLPYWWLKSGGTCWSWYLRNPICNMRFWPVISTKPSRSVRWIGTASEKGELGWFLAWQCAYVGWWWKTEKFAVWLGYKLNPRDAKKDAPQDYRYWGLGVAAQVERF